jgi:hypothetical protein
MLSHAVWNRMMLVEVQVRNLSLLHPAFATALSESTCIELLLRVVFSRCRWTASSSRTRTSSAPKISKVSSQYIISVLYVSRVHVSVRARVLPLRLCYVEPTASILNVNPQVYPFTLAQAIHYTIAYVVFTGLLPALFQTTAVFVVQM